MLLLLLLLLCFPLLTASSLFCIHSLFFYSWNHGWNRVENRILFMFEHVNTRPSSDLDQTAKILSQNVLNQVGCVPDRRILPQIEREPLDRATKTLPDFVLLSATIPAVGSCKACFQIVGLCYLSGSLSLDMVKSIFSRSIACSDCCQPSDGAQKPPRPMDRDRSQ